ncbi:MAG: tetratricopeptide repeat protein [Deltaproteobacteria bacterium]|nr:tetratricopeptide repeat protein [Deltaproteobacteria bacterium]
MTILAETAVSGCRRNLFAFISLLILTLIIYSNTFDASWHFDDENNILNNTPLHLTELSVPNITQTFFADWNRTGGLYRPVAGLSFALNYYFGGMDVHGYHMVNMAVHFLSAFFVFLFTHHALNLTILNNKYGKNSYFIALLSAVLWAINPVQTQAVTYVVQRMTSMAGLFYMMAMYFYLKGRTSTPGFSRNTLYFLFIICGILAMGSKENAITLPFSILLFDLFLIQGISKPSVKRSFFLFLIMGAACLFLGILLKGPAILDLQDLISRYQNRGFTLGERLLTEPRVILFYISLLFHPMPNRLCLEHDIIVSTGLLTPPSTLIAILVILAIIAAALSQAKKRPLISFCIIFFFLNHLIEGSILPLELIFEHRNYLPSMLFFVPISILLSGGIAFFSRKRGLRTILVIFVILVLVGWGHSTYARNVVWKNDGILSFDCVEKYPDLARPHHNLGRFYLKNEQYEAAIMEFQISLSKKDINNLAGKNWTYYNLGSVYQTLGNDDKALFYYEQAQKYQPSFAPTHIRKGQVFLKRGLYDEAAEEFHKALKSRKHLPSALTNLGHLFLQTGQTAKAVNHLKLALQSAPQDPVIMRRLGLAYMLDNQPAKAFILFKTSLEITPDDPFTLLELAALYGDRGMETKKQEVMNRFFAVFAESPLNLKRFIDGMRFRSDPQRADHSHQQHLLRFLAGACQERSREYAAMAEDCLRLP